MRAGLSLELVERLRRADPTVRIMIEADVVARSGLAEDLRQRKDQWNAADSLTGLTLYDDGAVQLTGGFTTVIQSTTSDGFLTDLDAASPWLVARIVWDGTEDTNFEIRQITAHLNPMRDPAVAKNVAKWKLELWALRLIQVSGGNEYRTLHQFAEKLIDASGTSAGDVVFDFSASPQRPKPKSFYLIGANPVTYVLIRALKADGSAATNVGWSRDSLISSVTSAGNVLSGRSLARVATGYLAGTYQDSSGNNVPRLAIKGGSFADATLTFSQAGNRIDLGGVPTADVQLRGHGLTPSGTQTVFQVLKDGGNPALGGDWVTYLDGQLTTDLANVGKRQTYEVRCQLKTNAGGTLTPTLISMGVREVTRVDLSDVAELTQARWAIDPVTLRGEIPEAVITVQRDGERDFEDAITGLLATNAIGDLLFRTWVGARDLAREKWLHLDDWLVDDYQPEGAEIKILCVSPLALVRQALPSYVIEAPAPPNADSANPGAWTDQAGGAVSLYQVVDEQVADDGDYVQSPVDPVNAALELALTDVADPLLSTNHLIRYRYSKDAAAGKTMDLTIELRQGAAVIASKLHSGIAETWTEGSFELTPSEADAITNYNDLRLRLIANVGGAGASRRSRVSWARFLVTGHRSPKTYTNQTLKAVYDDFVAVQLRDLLPRYRGPGVEATDLVTKEITESDGKVELDAIAFLAGAGLISSQGRLKAVDFFGPKSLVALFPGAEIEVLAASPGFRQRLPEVFLRYAWDTSEERFRAEARGFHATALTKLGLARVDPPTRIDDEIGKWVPADDLTVSETQWLSKKVTQRMADKLGAGLLLWSYRALYAHPELEPGDLVAIETDKFVAKAPNTGLALKGELWAIGLICEVDDGLGHDFGLWVQSYDDILSTGEAATRPGFGAPSVVNIGLTVSDTGAVALVVTTSRARSVRIASSTAGFPTKATVQAAAALALDAEGIYSTAALATLTDGQTLYLAVLAYETADGQGKESTLAQGWIAYRYLPASAIVSARAIWRANRLFVGWDGNSGVLSVKVATSTASYPADGTGTVAEGQDGLFDAGPFVYGDTVYITITPYPQAAAGGTAGRRHRLKARLTVHDTQFDEPSGKRKRAAQFDDATYALRASDTLGETGHANVKESGGKAVNRLYAKALAADADTLDSVVAGTNFKRLAAAYGDASERPTTLRRVTGAHDVTADQVSGAVGLDPLNMILNGGGQDGALGSQAPNWANAGGNAWVPATDFAKFGDRSLKVDNATAIQSRATQTVAVKVGRLYRVSAWIKTSALPVADPGFGAVLIVSDNVGVTGFTILEKRTVGADPIATRPDIGIAADGSAYDWTFVFCRFKCTGADGTIIVDPMLGYNGGQSGTAWFDGIRLEEEPVEHITRAHEVLDTSGTNKLKAAALESGGKAANRLLAKTLAADADSLDGTPDGVTYKRITGVSGGLVQTASYSVSSLTGEKLAGRFNCRLSLAVNYSLANAVLTALPWDNELWDNGGLHSLVTNTERITVPSGDVGGIWIITATIGFAANATGERYVLLWHSTLGGIAEVRVTTAHASLSEIVNLVGMVIDPPAGSYFEVRVYQNSGGGLNVLATSAGCAIARGY